MGGFLIGTDPTLRQTKTPNVDTFAAGVGFTAGSSTSVALSADPGAEQHLTVFFDGVGQHRSTYSVSGTTLTFDTAIPTGTAEVEATYGVTVPSVTVPDNSVTLAKLAGGTDGELITWNASGDPAAVGAGTSGHFLKSQGAGSVPVFAADNKGAMTFISSTDISGAATFNFTAVDASAYDSYIMYVHNLVPVTDAVNLFLRTSTDGGSSYDNGGSDYNWEGDQQGIAYQDLTAEEIRINAGGAGADHTIGSAAGEDGLVAVINIHAPHLTKQTFIHADFGHNNASGDMMCGSCIGARLSAADVDAWQLLFSSGNIETGTVNVYGLANA